MNTFERDGVRFRYPGNWSVEAEDTDDGGWTVSVHSPEFAFMVVSLRPEASDPAQVVDETLAALRAEYKELDADDAIDAIAGRPAIGHDIDILSLDTAVSCRSRCVETPAGPLLVMAQSTDYDREQNDPVLQAVWASLEVDEE